VEQTVEVVRNDKDGTCLEVGNFQASGNREWTHRVDLDGGAIFEETKRGSLEALNTSVFCVKKGRESPSESSKETRRDEARVEWRELLA
jgi:hypothetical protein